MNGYNDDADAVADLESRFSFHSVNEFPPPDNFTNCSKTYPSIVGASKQTSEFVAYCCQISCCLQNSFAFNCNSLLYGVSDSLLAKLQTV